MATFAGMLGGAAVAVTVALAIAADGLLLAGGIALLGGVLVGSGIHAVMRRALSGAPLLEREYMVHFDGDEGVTVASLIELMVRLQLSAGIDGLNRDQLLVEARLCFRLGAPPHPDFGDAFALRERDGSAVGEVVVGPFVHSGSGMWSGTVACTDRQDGPHEIFALFIIYALAHLFPSLRYRDPYSAFGAQPASDLRWQVPAIGERIDAIRGEL